MLRDALFLAGADAARMLRTGPTILWTFVMPVIFFYFIGSITGNSSGGDSQDPLAVSVPPDAGFLADRVIARLEARDYHVVRPKTPEEFASYRRRLEIPAGFTDAVLAGHAIKVRFSRTGEDVGRDYDRGRIARAVYTTLADLVAIGGERC